MRPSTASHSTRKTDCTATSAARSGGHGGPPDRAACAGVFWRRFAFARRHLAVPGVALPARPGLLVLTAVLLVGLCTVLTSWGARNAHSEPDPAGFDLLA